MNHTFSPSLARPNLPLRKPSSRPSAASPFPGLAMPGGSPLRSSSLSPGAIPPASVSAASPVYLCHFCAQQGNLRCKRCKKVTYCSALCQKEDWKAHRHICIEAQPEKENPNLPTALPVMPSNSNLPDLKADAFELHRVYLKDLHRVKTKQGSDIQASVVEFYNPGRFFLLAQSPELLDTLQSISSKLQKTSRCPSGTTYIPRVGEVCTAQFSDDLLWYRGLVQKVVADKKAHMLYIDYGNEEDVPYERIKPLPADLEPFHPCAMECHVAAVEPVDGSWSNECCTAVKQLLAGRTVTTKLVETLKNVHAYAVDIQISVGKYLSSFLVERGFAVKATVDIAPTEQNINAMLSASLENFKRHSEGKDDNTWAQVPEPLTQAVGDSFSVVITHLQSPDNMIVQKVENAGVIQELQLKLRLHCSQVPTPQNFRPAPGTVCCAQFSEDKQWYRAKVLGYSSEERVCVGYIDFGNSEDIDLGDLRPISSSLLALPMQAIPCALAGVQPVGESWPEVCLLALQRSVSNRILRTEIQGAHKGKALVTMVDEASDPQSNITELLISAGYGVPSTVKANDVQQSEQPTAAAEPQVCEPLIWSSVELPTDGQLVVLSTTLIVNPGEFFCHIDNPADRQQLITLIADLKQHCEADVAAFEPKVGDPCCAMFPGDGAWYRAKVNGQSEDTVTVNFVDYGYSMELEKRHLRSVTPRLLQLPFQAVRCFLSGVEAMGSEWSSEAILWFQTQVDGEKMNARVLTVTKQGYGVELECRGQSIAAGLISNVLGRVPGEIPKGVHSILSPGAKQREDVKEKEHSQTQASKQMPTVEGVATQLSGPTFPVDWKTMELPINEPFKPYIAAVTSPSLFYLLSPNQVDQQKHKEMMLELAAFCCTHRATLSSSTDHSRLTPGVACCAQFSADDNWYRAVVLEVADNEVSVIYADFGNTEKLPVSRIFPIPEHLLQLPFPIARCTLTGKEHFPAQWPPQVLQMFHGLLLSSVLATAHSFDGSFNVLSVTLPAERGGAHLTALVLDALQAHIKNPYSPSPAMDQKDSTSSATLLHHPKPHLTCTVDKSVENTAVASEPLVGLQPTPQSPQQMQSIAAEPHKEAQTSGCCCQSLKTKLEHLELKMERLEQKMELQLSLLKQCVERLQS
ncbi:tudor domain-containing protein 1 isoform X2 [Dunckerocampus dactyliophorus]|uniref:tudor domain-containing protein 1 isoform X2 n=1 Tax=Dunckerocampus dactyliophorus TaxID=161453 RepID=UPI0024052146|nr:tudor domain-containing protein 1 isoform X2 [Dunckerocampus dactyliophorus]